MARKALWVVVGLTLPGMLGCGNSQLTSVSLSPAIADAQNFPGGQVPFTATGTYGGSSKPVPLANITWCIGTAGGQCFGNVVPPVTVDSRGLAQCLNNSAGTFTVLAGTATQPRPPIPDGRLQLKVYGTAQLTCP